MASNHESGSVHEFPTAKFELLVRTFLDNVVDWEVMHNFAMAHFYDTYAPEYQRPIEDLHMMFFPPVAHDHELHSVRPQIRYLLDLLDLLKQDVEQYGEETIRERELARMAEEAPEKRTSRREYREQHRPKNGMQ